MESQLYFTVVIFSVLYSHLEYRIVGVHMSPRNTFGTVNHFPLKPTGKASPGSCYAES